METTSEDLCLVCKETLFDEGHPEDASYEATSCGHIFHRTCLTEHLKLNESKCPNCEVRVNQEENVNSWLLDLRYLVETNTEKTDNLSIDSLQNFHKSTGSKENNNSLTMKKLKDGNASTPEDSMCSGYESPSFDETFVPSNSAFDHLLPPVRHPIPKVPLEVLTPEILTEKLVTNARAAKDAARIKQEQFLIAQNKLLELNKTKEERIKALESEVKNAKKLQQKAEVAKETYKLRAKNAEQELANMEIRLAVAEETLADSEKKTEFVKHMLTNKEEELRVAEQKLATSEEQLRLAEIEISKYKESQKCKESKKKEAPVPQEKSTENKQNHKAKDSVLLKCMELL